MTPAALVLPLWLVLGIALGIVLSVGVALAFYVGTRRYGRGTADGSGDGSSADGPRRSGDRTATDGGVTGRAGARVDGTERRRREIRHYLQAIGEPYREDHEVAGAEVAFYLPERDVAVTFDARAYFRIEEAGHDAVLCEHELPGANLGGRLPFDAPTFGAGAGGASGGPTARGNRGGAGRGIAGRLDDAERERARRVRAAFATLGLPPDAGADAVETAYRRRIKEVHPDHGGDREQFGRVREAYELASQNAD